MKESLGIQATEKLADVKIEYYRAEGDIKNIAGQILTIVDASFSDERQCKAVKDLIRREFSKLLYSYQEASKEGHSVLID